MKGTDSVVGAAGASANYQSVAGASVESSGDYSSVLLTAPGMRKRFAYANLTPWVSKLFFVHTYYVYIYVFLLFVLLFYKGYALEYPMSRRWYDMVMCMLLPPVQHLRFYFGHWGCQLGMWVDLSLFLCLCGLTNCLLMYFQYGQAYIMPMDSTLMFTALCIVSVEGMCGCINILQMLKTQVVSCPRMVTMSVSIFVFLLSMAIFVVQTLIPHQAYVQEMTYMARNVTHVPR